MLICVMSGHHGDLHHHPNSDAVLLRARDPRGKSRIRRPGGAPRQRGTDMRQGRIEGNK